MTFTSGIMSASQPHYTVLARRFRPQTFEDVVGQEHVGQALRNAIRGERVAHAYLFTGARGVGKTSTARIFAKALNCPNAADGVPCNECDVCQSIAAGNDVDVLEIDGASNRGIDDIRTLRANVNVRSMRSKYKVYIIDEVHMLTKEAFNALLKTLEEPPPNVKFVFCTTEPNKVPDTILSRCQRFDFGMIGTPTISLRLARIAEAEGVQVEAEAIELVARRAGGSMRDAQSLFDQLLAFGNDRIGPDDVHRLLGTAPDERLVELADACIAADAGRALALANEALASGVQLASLGDQLLDYLRDVIVAGVGADGVALVGVAERLRGELQRQASAWGVETATAAMQILIEAKSRMQRVNYGRALLDLALTRICLLERLDSIANLQQELRSASGGATTGVRPSPAAPRAPASRTPVEAVSKKNGLDSTPVHRARDEADLQHQQAESQGATDTISEESGSERLDLQPDSVEAFWSQLLLQSSDTIAAQLKNATQTAISGPNALEIVFPPGYSFSRTYCERPETLKRIESTASTLAGRPVRIVIRGEANPASIDKPKAGSAHQPRPRPLESVRSDPFVQQIVSVFGGTVVEVRNAAGPAESEV
jgi:DNA polymerase-3 subunit gamma/tau